MTPVLCLNCGKARGEHFGCVWCHSGYGSSSVLRMMRWAEPPQLLESASEQRTVEQIATWLESNSNHRYQAIGALIRSGAWKVKP